MLSTSSDAFAPLRDPNSVEGKTVDAYGTIRKAATDPDEVRATYGIVVDGENCPPPVCNFQDMNLPKGLLDYLTIKKMFIAPTPIQMQAISCLLHGRDVIALGPTGCGKSLAYILPMCLFLLKDASSSIGVGSKAVCPKCLILVPTRELVAQISLVADELLSCLIDSKDGQPPSAPERKTSDRLPPLSTGPASVSSLPFASPVPSFGNFAISPSHEIVNAAHHSGRPFLAGLPWMGTTWPCYGGQAPFQLMHSRPNSYPGSEFQDQNLVSPTNFRQASPYMSIPSEISLRPAERTKWHRVVGVCGGVPVHTDVERLKSGVAVLVATPGRLLDLCDREYVSLRGVSYLVIDECDKCLEMGLEEQLRKLVAMVNVAKVPLQTSLWSATLPDSLERLARSAVVNPVLVSTGVRDTVSVNVTQHVLFMHSYERPKFLLDTLRQTPFPPVILFVNTIESANEVGHLLAGEQFHVAVLHSEKDQSHRNKVMDAFRRGRVDVLVATDLASRGLDVPDVTHVINYEIPTKIEDYIHRCGRTGRFGRKGVATSFLTLECKIASELKELLESTGNVLPVELHDTKDFGGKVIKTAMGDRVVR